MKKLLLSILLLPLMLVGCGGEAITYEQISQDEAKRLMDTEKGYVIIDARTESEFSEGHIPNAILIPEYEISARAENEIPDKDTLILVYCRSGRRSKIAVEALVETLEGDLKTGAQIVRRVLEEPMRQIAANAGLEGSVIVNQVRTHEGINYGFDAQNEVYVNLMEAGIVDPTKVTRSALQNAASVAAMVLTTESLIAERKEDADAANAAAAAAAAAGGGMY